MAVVQVGQHAIMGMMQKSVEDNIAGITENIVDTLIIGQIANSVSLAAGVVGTKCLDAANGINITIPKNLLDATPKIMNGQAVAVAGGQTINLGEAIAAGAEGLRDPLTGAGILAAQANNIANKSKGSGGKGNLPVIEPKYGTKEWSEQYPKGKYNGDTYHKSKASATKSPAPRDGQACLDRSFEVEGATQRITIEDGKIVILQDEGHGIYHGYVIEDFHLLQENIQKAFVDKGLVRTVKSGKVVKK